MIPWPAPALPTAPEIDDHVQRLRPWSRIWRYLVTAVTGLLFLVFVSVDFLGPSIDDLAPAVENYVGGLLFLDIALGTLALCLLPLRRRHPVPIAAITAAFSAVSASSLAPAIWATISMSTHRRWKGVAVVGVIWGLATVVYELVLRASVPGITMYPGPWASGSLALAIYAICVATGFYIGARRALLTSLRERAETAEREQALRAASARDAERTRIAREMHDVLAHRISLVALHAGALTYRTDLTREETAQAAGIIQDNAHLALTELRQVLGVLRSGPAGVDASPPEPAQPTLAELPALLAEAREAGMTVRVAATDAPTPAILDAAEVTGSVTGSITGSVTGSITELVGLSPTVSRTAYRIIQEALTNARKHAPGQPVTLHIEHSGDLLLLRAANPVFPHADPGLQGGGVGLIGLCERAELADGRIEHGTDAGSFILRAWLPWT
ncbi:two-component sensor histidine kinase [Cryobacterium frigoriphilum]|uniref:histidine kinase n=1 Tax=Cryobacterium frigoriphilum TaxID=1259150 RepID=A0A4R9A888_9MICO|nr:histidine kinase [Cryobacterium frigoriphilum]TFD54055.1 two-component sensor histidine kinase [Cryobacterium frigoriphilum]